jgi:hypothetical protein
MGMYDTVICECPNCRSQEEFQSKSGDCILQTFDLKDCPDDILQDVNRHAPCNCTGCGIILQVNIKNREVEVPVWMNR